MERSEPTAEASFAAMRERSRFGIAMAAMIRMIATTISNSISEKPFCFLMVPFFPFWYLRKSSVNHVPMSWHFADQRGQTATQVRAFFQAEQFAVRVRRTRRGIFFSKAAKAKLRYQILTRSDKLRWKTA